VLTFGDGWHNDHHAQPSSSRHGFFWWQPDATWCLTSLMERVGLIWEAHRPRFRTSLLPEQTAIRPALRETT
jgi:stearoyl-CoA desaturase (delta-9 desaturase)